jgi:hypothetical protein
MQAISHRQAGRDKGHVQDVLAAAAVPDLLLIHAPCCCHPPFRCIEGLKFTTTTGQTAMVGGGGNNLAKALSDAYVYGFKGTAGVGMSCKLQSFTEAAD